VSKDIRAAAIGRPGPLRSKTVNALSHVVELLSKAPTGVVGPRNELTGVSCLDDDVPPSVVQAFTSARASWRPSLRTRTEMCRRTVTGEISNRRAISAGE
jgi:hypothetical protein